MDKKMWLIGGTISAIIVIIIVIVLSVVLTKTPDVDCVVSNWEPCSKECGGGTQTRKIITPASGNGQVCPDESALSQTCNTQACTPVPAPNSDCKVSDWGSCSKECGGGTQTRTIVTPATGNGKPCPNDSELSQPCNPQACIVDTDCQVSDWGSCSKECGGGTQTRTVVTPSSGKGKTCPELSQSCNTQPCPQPIWSDWGDCSKSCGGGVQRRVCLKGTCVGDAEKKCNEKSCDEFYYDVPNWTRAGGKYVVTNSITGWSNIPLSQCGLNCSANPACKGFVYGFPAMYSQPTDKANKGSCRLHSKINWTDVQNQQYYGVYSKPAQ